MHRFPNACIFFADAKKKNKKKKKQMMHTVLFRSVLSAI